MLQCEAMSRTMSGREHGEQLNEPRNETGVTGEGEGRVGHK